MAIQPQGPESYPDVIRAGEVMAQLNDWRAILFVAIFIIVFQFIFIVWREWSMNNERKGMRDVADNFASSAAKVADSLAELSTKIAVLSALTARAEAYVAKATEENGHG